MDENGSGLFIENFHLFANVTDPFDEDFEESNKMHGNQCICHGLCTLSSLSVFHLTTDFNSNIQTSISVCFFLFPTLPRPCIILLVSAVNGRMYGNLEGLEMCAGDQVVWYTLGLGTEVDLHGIYFEGNTFKKQSTTRDTLSVFPHTTAAVTMQPNTPG